MLPPLRHRRLLPRLLPGLLPIALLLSGGALAAPAAPAAPAEAAAPEEIVWTCALAPQSATSVLCHRTGPMGMPVDFDDALDTLPDHRAIRQKLLAGGGSNVGRLVRGAPDEYGKLMWRIPLHAAPFDDERLQMLVEAVMCGTEERCRVELGPRRLATAPALPPR